MHHGPLDRGNERAAPASNAERVLQQLLPKSTLRPRFIGLYVDRPGISVGKLLSAFLWIVGNSGFKGGMVFNGVSDCII